MVKTKAMCNFSPPILVDAAKDAAVNAYAPYSRFHVGAALLASSGKIYAGANVENASYPCGICAERSAVARAVSEGERNFTAIALVAFEGDGEAKGVTPCGMCRQVLGEFASKDGMDVFTLSEGGAIKRYALDELLPHSFSINKKEGGGL